MLWSRQSRLFFLPPFFLTRFLCSHVANKKGELEEEEEEDKKVDEDDETKKKMKKEKRSDA